MSDSDSFGSTAEDDAPQDERPGHQEESPYSTPIAAVKESIEHQQGRWAKRAGWAQLVLSVVGLLVNLVFSVFWVRNFTTLVLLLVLMGVMAFGVWSAHHYIKGTPWAGRACTIYQVAQVPIIQSGIFSYFLSLGLMLGASLQFGQPPGVHFLWKTWFGGIFEVVILGANPLSCGVNLTPLLILYWINKDQKEKGDAEIKRFWAERST